MEQLSDCEINNKKNRILSLEACLAETDAKLADALDELKAIKDLCDEGLKRLLDKRDTNIRRLDALLENEQFETYRLREKRDRQSVVIDGLKQAFVGMKELAIL